MKKFNRIIIAILAVAMLLALGACNKDDNTDANPSDSGAPVNTDNASGAGDGDAANPDETESDTPDAGDGTFTTVEDGKLYMATNAAFPPYEFIDGEEFAGIDVEIAGMIAEKLGLTLEIADIDFNSIVTSVQTGKYDMGMAGMTVTDERLENVNFSVSYATGVQVVVVKEDSSITSIEDLDGAKIGVQEATTGHIYCEDDYGVDNVIPYTTGAVAIQALVTDKIDCVVIDNQPAKAYVEANPGLKILDTEYVIEDYAICMAKGNDALLAAVNNALQELIADGTVQSILDKYIAAE